MANFLRGYHMVHKYNVELKQKKKEELFTPKWFVCVGIIALVTLGLWNMPAEWLHIDGLTVVQQRIIAIFAFATLMWVFELVPAWATSVTIIGALLLFTSNSAIKPFVQDADPDALLSYSKILASFADPVIMLFLGGFILALATTKVGLDAHLARIMLKPFGTKPHWVLLGFILITGTFSMFVSNTATAAMMLAFLTPVFKQINDKNGKIALALSIPIAANIGGMGTPVGTPPNAIVLKYLNDPQALNLNIGFGEWMAFMMPLTIVLLIIGWLVLRLLYPFRQKSIEIKISGSLKKDAQTYIVIVTFIVTVLLWMLDKQTGINSYTVAMIPIVVFALTGVTTAYDLQQLNWSVIWMVAGGFALGYAFNASGLADNAIRSIPFDAWSPFLILLVSGFICYMLSNFISNSATAALLAPILAIVCAGMGDKLSLIGGSATVLIGIAIAASSAMVLPISTPPNALAFSTDLMEQKDMAKVGLTVGIIALVLGYGTLYLLGVSGFFA